MNNNYNRHGIGMGSTSVLLIFIIVTLAVFSVLSLVTADRESELAKKSAESSKAYYAAEAKAFAVYDDISKAISEMFSEDMLAETLEPLNAACFPDGAGYIIRYETEIDPYRTLESVLRYENGKTEIIGWKTTGEAEQYDDTVSIWDGEGLPFET